MKTPPPYVPGLNYSHLFPKSAPLKKHKQTYAEYVATVSPEVPSPGVEKFAKFFGYSVALVMIGVPAILFCGFIGFHSIALFLLIWWALSCFRNDIADEVVRRQQISK